MLTSSILNGVSEFLPSGCRRIMIEDDTADVEDASQQLDEQVEDANPQTCHYQ